MGRCDFHCSTLTIASLSTTLSRSGGDPTSLFAISQLVSPSEPVAWSRKSCWRGTRSNPFGQTCNWKLRISNCNSSHIEHAARLCLSVPSCFWLPLGQEIEIFSWQMTHETPLHSLRHPTIGNLLVLRRGVSIGPVTVTSSAEIRVATWRRPSLVGWRVSTRGLLYVAWALLVSVFHRGA